jgi:hypothetical protein
LFDAETRSVQRIAGGNFRHRRHPPVEGHRWFVGMRSNCRQVNPQGAAIPPLGSVEIKRVPSPRNSQIRTAGLSP